SFCEFTEHSGAFAIVLPPLERIRLAVMCEEVIRERLEFGTDTVCVIAEEPLDGDRSSTLSAEAMLTHFFDRSAAGACHRDRRAGAIGADLLPVHESGEIHLASARPPSTRLSSRLSREKSPAFLGQTGP